MKFLRRELLCAQLAGAAILGASLPVHAANPRASEPIACPGSALGPVLPAAPSREDQPIVIYARYLDASKNDGGEARENVELFRADQHLSTERVLYNPQTGQASIPGVLNYSDQQLWIDGQEASYNFQQEEGKFSTISYGIAGSSAHGNADRIELTGGSTSRLYGLVYTSCPGTEPDWILSAKELELRHDEGLGIARGAKLEFKGVPILYAPYFTFPLDDRRKSGFLYPNLAHTNDKGFEFSVPWYWNIAPDQDATLEPHYYTSRGTMLSAEYRFLTPRSNGEINVDYMPWDSETETARYRYKINQQARPWARWNTGLIVDRVGDDDYFQDFGSSIYETSLQFLRSSATMTGVGNYWNLEMLVDDFQVIDDGVLPENEPYARLPRIAFWMDRPLGRGGAGAKLNSELVYFDRDSGTTGARLDLSPSLYWEEFTSWGFIKPAAGYRYTAYNLDRFDGLGNATPTRGTFIGSVDSGLYFDRRNANGSTQTLEPRLFYLYVPYKDQADLPQFDTAEYTFGFSQLFNTDRFTGADRQSEANQLALAISTRNYNSTTGDVQWSLNVGQIFYFQSLKIQLDDEPELSDDFSPIIAEFNWHPFTRFSARTGAQFDWDTNKLEVAGFGVTYAGNHGERASFEYRYRRERVDQFDFRVFWPVNESWSILSRVNYSFADDDLLEVQGGIEYESCCWAVRTVLRRFLKNRDGDYRDGIFVELNLKGLASIGTRAENLFNY